MTTMGMMEMTMTVVVVAAMVVMMIRLKKILRTMSTVRTRNKNN